MGKTFFPNISHMKYCTVILGKDFVHLSSFIPQILDFFFTFYSMVYIFIFDGVTVKTENIWRTKAELKHAGIALKRSKMLGTTKNKTRRQGIEEVVVYIYCYFYAVNNYR